MILSLKTRPLSTGSQLSNSSWFSLPCSLLLTRTECSTTAPEPNRVRRPTEMNRLSRSSGFSFEFYSCSCATVSDPREPGYQTINYFCFRPAFKFVLVFIGFLLSRLLNALGMPIANTPSGTVRRSPGSHCAMWRSGTRKLADGSVPPLSCRRQRLSEQIVWD